MKGKRGGEGEVRGKGREGEGKRGGGGEECEGYKGKWGRFRRRKI